MSVKEETVDYLFSDHSLSGHYGEGHAFIAVNEAIANIYITFIVAI